MTAKDKNKFLKLFECCIPVKGAKRSVICDTQRQLYFFIPNDMYLFLNLIANKTIKTIYSEFGIQNRDIIDEYIDFLLVKELAFITEIPKVFPPISQVFNQPEKINNSILDFNFQSNYNYSKAISELEELGCKSIQLRFFGEYKKIEFEKILTCFADTSFNSIEIICSTNKTFTRRYITNLLMNNRRLSVIYLFNSQKEEVVEIQSNTIKTAMFIKQSLMNDKDCGCISPSYFSINLPHIIEAKNSNTCLNKKISITTDGLIKNCPSMENSYGMIDNTNLKTVLKLKNFQALWAIKKDSIEICKDCEFRYICSDCRAFTQDNRSNSKPLKCNYDPYNATWN